MRPRPGRHAERMSRVVWRAGLRPAEALSFRLTTVELLDGWGAIGVVRGTLWAPSRIHGWARVRYGQCGKRARLCSKGTALWRRGRQEHALARSVSSRVERPRRPSRSPGRADHLLHLALLDHIIKALPRAQKHLSVKPWTTRPQAQIPSGKPSRDYEMRATVSSNFRSVCARSSSGAASHGNFPEN